MKEFKIFCQRLFCFFVGILVVFCLIYLGINLSDFFGGRNLETKLWLPKKSEVAVDTGPSYRYTFKDAGAGSLAYFKEKLITLKSFKDKDFPEVKITLGAVAEKNKEKIIVEYTGLGDESIFFAEKVINERFKSPVLKKSLFLPIPLGEWDIFLKNHEAVLKYRLNCLALIETFLIVIIIGIMIALITSISISDSGT